MKNNKMMAKIFIGIFVSFYLINIFVLVFSPYSYSEISGNAFEPITAIHLFGTDSIGRDMLVRVCLATITSIHIAIFSVICGLLIGVQYGCVAGYHQGKINKIMTAILDIIESIPEFLCAMMLMTFFNGILNSNNSGIWGIFVTLVVVSWTSMARIIKNEVLILMNENYIIYALLKKASYFHIFRWHLLPNLKGTIISTIIQKIPSAIFLEAFLSFIGLGIQPPFPSLGKLISSGVTVFRMAPVLLIIPSIFLFIIVLLFNLFGYTIKEEE